MGRTLKVLGAMLVAGWAVACGGKTDARTSSADSSGRNLALAPAESSAKPINDRPISATTASKGPERKPAATPAKPEAKAPEPRPQPQPPAPEPPPPSLATGTSLSLAAVDSINSRHNAKGDPVTATLGADVKDSLGRTVIPAGAVLVGRVSDIDAGHPGSPGRLVITFSRVQFGGKSYGITAHVDSMATVEKGRAVQATDAAKVGAGAVVGGILGRLIGGNKTGTIVGAAAGGAAGAGVAAKTRDVDIVLPAGAYLRVTLTAPFDKKEIM
jgi:hypothetical protein